MKPKFELGHVVCTRGALIAFAAARTTPDPYILRHVTGDWGVLDDDDKKQNEEALKLNLRILSAYTLPNGTKIYVITDADRSSTTILLPEEY